MSKKYWEVLLNKWRENGKDGFTIPYLIGSQNRLNKEIEKDTIRDIITDIANGDNDIYITYCMDIDDIIVGIRDERKIKIAGKFVNIDNSISKLYLTNGVSELGEDVESIIESLIDRYQQHIDRGEYSRNDRDLGDFSIEEIEFIDSIFKENNL